MRLSENEQEIERISSVLGIIFHSVRWDQMRGRSKYDIFQHRLNVAVRQSSITAMLQKLCHGLNLQAPEIDPKLIEYLDKNEETIFKLIREATQYFTYKAAEKAKEVT